LLEVQVLNPKILYTGQNKLAPVNNGANANKPHQLLKYKPAPAINTASRNLIILSVFPILQVIIFNLTTQILKKLCCNKLRRVKQKYDVHHVPVN